MGQALQGSSVHIDGDHVEYGAGRQQIDEWNVEHMPKREEPFIRVELSDSLSFVEIDRDKVDGLSISSSKLRMSLELEHLPEFSRTTPLAEPARPSNRGKVPPRTKERTLDMHHVGLEGLQPLLHPRRKVETRLRIYRLPREFFLQDLQRCTGPVESVVNFRIDETPDDPAEDDPQHAEQRHGSIGRTDVKGRVEQDECGTDDTEPHMDTEPVFEGPPPLHPAYVLAERISQEREHHQSADDAQVKAKVRARRVVLTRRYFIRKPYCSAGKHESQQLSR